MARQWIYPQHVDDEYNEKGRREEVESLEVETGNVAMMKVEKGKVLVMKVELGNVSVMKVESHAMREGKNL